MERNLTRETRHADDSLTALCHLKEEMKSKHGDIVALKNEQGEILALKNEIQWSNTL